MNSVKNWVVLCTALILGGAYVAGKHVERAKHEEPMTVSVTTRESVSATPDTAELNFGVTTGRQSDPVQAMDSLSGKMNAALGAVKKLGLKEGDIGTHSLSLQPSYDHDKEGNATLKGFEASQTLHLRVCDLKLLGPALQAAVKSGANQAGNIRFSVTNTEELTKDAKEKAIEKAKKEAEALAQKLGKKLGNLRGYSEGISQPREEGAYRARVADAVPTPAGSQTLTVSVTLTYEVH